MSQFTKEAIIQTFIEMLNDRPFEKITVTDLIEKCGISRNTFYYYFQDIYDLLGQMFISEEKRLLESEDRGAETLKDSFLNATQFLRENKKAVYHIYHSVDHVRLEQFISKIIQNRVKEYIDAEAEGISCEESDKNALSYFYSSALLGICLNWLNNDMKDDAVAYIDKMNSMLDGAVKETLIRYSKKRNL